jgi:uncharacterized paraquat-inducible protein A
VEVRTSGAIVVPVRGSRIIHCVSGFVNFAYEIVMTDEPTKTCPYCAETIKAAAVVCKHCGRDLTEKPMPTTTDDRALLQQEVARLTATGWQVVSQSDAGAQLRKPKEWSKAGVVLLVLLPVLGAALYGPLLYVAIGGLILVVADYLIKKERSAYVTAEQVQQAHQADREGVARVAPKGQGFACSACGGAIREDATECKHCKKKLYVPAEFVKR